MLRSARVRVGQPPKRAAPRSMTWSPGSPITLPNGEVLGLADRHLARSQQGLLVERASGCPAMGSDASSAGPSWLAAVSRGRGEAK